MYAQSKPYPDMIKLVRGLKTQYGLQVAAVSNEGRELTGYRIQQFELRTFVDFFVSSCFVHYRKPDEDIYRIALDISQAQAQQVIYIDDREIFVEVARELGITGIIHAGLPGDTDVAGRIGSNFVQLRFVQCSYPRREAFTRRDDFLI